MYVVVLFLCRVFLYFFSICFYIVVSKVLDLFFSKGTKTALIVVALRGGFEREIVALESGFCKKNIDIVMKRDFVRGCDWACGVEMEDVQKVLNQGPEGGFRLYKLTRS